MGRFTHADIKDLGHCWVKVVDLRYHCLYVAATAGLLTEHTVYFAQLREDSKQVDIEILSLPSRGLRDCPAPDFGLECQNGGCGLGAEESVLGYPST